MKSSAELADADSAASTFATRNLCISTTSLSNNKIENLVSLDEALQLFDQMLQRRPSSPSIYSFNHLLGANGQSPK
ncbi:hypothetical protein AQUCO_01700651v1 [Aquilegia coerulea]|uniref:Pentatricopeptide repeat-containing protein n=1 Tax=Aquilegia coerulea TaxID=218851 RepID=A0A2G5DP34_AQUCA|nr:hypothetical protein AQUCO_01700651v1 [Aquilegia coerulea]